MTESKVESIAADLSFEQALAELEAIVTRMEAGQVTLDEAVQLYERGTLLQRACGDKLEQARLRIEKIQVSADGQVIAEAMDDPTDKKAG